MLPTEEEQRRRKVYDDLVDAIGAAAALEGCEGLLTDWVVLVGYQQFQEDGSLLTTVGDLLPYPGTQPLHRTLGLIDYAQAVLRHCAVAAEDTEY